MEKLTTKLNLITMKIIMFFFLYGATTLQYVWGIRIWGDGCIFHVKLGVSKKIKNLRKLKKKITEKIELWKKPIKPIKILKKPAGSISVL